MDETDTELKQRWERYLATEANAKAGGGALTADLIYERETIIATWKRLLEKKSRGELTDPTHIERAESLLREIAAIHGYKVIFVREEGARIEGSMVAGTWELSMLYGGDTKAIDAASEARWDKLVEKMGEELKALPFIKNPLSPVVFLGVDPSEVPHDYYHRDYSRPGAPWYPEEDDDTPADERPASEDEESCDPYARFAATWVVDVWVWDGPSEGRGRPSRRM